MFRHSLLRLLGSSRSFTPAAISGLQTWFKADAITGLSDGAAVASWTDSSGNGKNAAQGTGSLQPLYKTAILNGKPVVRFDGTDDRLVTASITHGIGAGDIFYAAVFKTQASQAGYKALQDLGTDAPAMFVTGGRPNFYVVGDKLFATTLSNATWYTLIMRRFSSTMECYINGAKDATTFSNSNGLPSAAITLGSEGGGGQYFGSDMAEIMFGKTLSDSDLAGLTAYLRAKYAHY